MQIVSQRTPADCAVAALASIQGWNYERARETLGRYASATGTCLQPLAMPLLRAGIGASYIMVRDHPGFKADQAQHSDIRFFPTAAEIREQLVGRPAIVAIDGSGFGVEFIAGRAHAIAWDGAEAVECGTTGVPGCPDRAPSVIDLEQHRILEALILSEAPVATARPAPVQAKPPTALNGADTSAVAAIFRRHERAVLAFSGGKEAICLAHMLESWRDRITLAWVNTGLMAEHMVRFVRAYRDRGWTLEELQSPNVVEHWQTAGIPAEVFPQANITEGALPRLQPWAHCCRTIRQEPLNAYLREQSGPLAFINGQRKADVGGATVSGLASQIPPTVEVVQPLADWSEAQVFAYVAQHGLELPPQYRDGYADSIECIYCPATITAERLSYLQRNYPEALPVVIGEAQRAVAASTQALVGIATLTAQYAPPLPLQMPGAVP